MRNLSLNTLIDRRFNHDNLYQFWSRSQGLWLSKLVKVTIRLLDEQELLAINPIHALEQPEFGIRLG